MARRADGERLTVVFPLGLEQALQLEGEVLEVRADAGERGGDGLGVEDGRGEVERAHG